MASKTTNNKKCILEKRPKLLKDFLVEFPNSPSLPSSSSSSEFKSYPRRLPDPHHDPPHTLQRSRSRSRAAAEAAITSFHKLLNAVKSFQYYYPSSSRSLSSSAPLTLPRSFSKKLLGKLSVKKKRRSSNSNSHSHSNSKAENEGMTRKVKLKDILRWRSFRDLEELRSRTPPQCHYINDVVDTNPRVATSKNGSRSGSGSGSSWGEPEFSFTADKLPCWSGNSVEGGETWDKINDVVVTDSIVGPEEDTRSMASEDDKEQHSPVSVLDSPFREDISDEEFVSAFDKSLANMERTKKSLLQSIQWFESLAGVADLEDETELVEEELGIETINKDNAIVAKTRVCLSRAMRTLDKGGQCLNYNEEFIKGMMRKREQCSQIEDEQKELGVELEVQVLSDLVNEVLVDLYGSNVDCCNEIFLVH